MVDTVFDASADLMPIRGGMGMDAGAVTGKGDAVSRDEPVLEGGDECGKAENLLEPFLIMEREILMLQGISGQLVGDAGMLIGKLLPFARFLRGLCVFVFGEKIHPAGPLGSFGLGPEP